MGHLLGKQQDTPVSSWLSADIDADYPVPAAPECVCCVYVSFEEPDDQGLLLLRLCVCVCVCVRACMRV